VEVIMTEEKPDRPDLTPTDVRMNFMRRRQNKIVEEIERNRRGEYTVPTWVLAAILVVIVLSFAALIYFTP
jgi:hypothetical protein